MKVTASTKALRPKMLGEVYEQVRKQVRKRTKVLGAKTEMGEGVWMENVGGEGGRVREGDIVGVGGGHEAEAPGTAPRIQWMFNKCFILCWRTGEADSAGLQAPWRKAHSFLKRPSKYPPCQSAGLQLSRPGETLLFPQVPGKFPIMQS